MHNAVRFATRTREQLSEVASSRAIAIVPLGATEQHGRRLPVVTDTLVISQIVERAAQAADADVAILPAVPFGFSEHHLPFGGTVSVDSETYIRLVVSIGRSLAADGFHRVLFANGHGGNVSPGGVAVDRLSGAHPNVAFGFISYWELLPGELIAEHATPTPGHAGGFEESLVAAIDPTLINDGVRADLSGRPDPLPLLTSDRLRGVTRIPGMWQESDGVTDTDPADVAFGARVLDTVSVALAGYISEFDAATRR